jgi:arylsulfatase A-like enzyme
MAFPAGASMQEHAMPNGKPNILFIMGDDIGWFNPSCYNSGMMGYKHAQHRPDRQ